MTVHPVFVRDGERFSATDLAHGPWYEGALHGGATAALIVHEIERHPASSALRLARLTCDFVAPVPSEGLSVELEVVRPGRRVTLLEAVVRDAGDAAVCRARALLLDAAELGAAVAGAGEPSPPGPEQGVPSDWISDGRRMFATDAMEVRFIEGSFLEPGPATAWLRLRGPLVGELPPSPLQRLAAASDFGNGIASVLEWDRHVFINADLTVHIEREPVDEWVALRSRMRVAPGSVAIAESTLLDRRGRIGLAIQSLVVGERRDRARPAPGV